MTDERYALQVVQQAHDDWSRLWMGITDKGKFADRLLFAGSGATAGANRLVAMLGLVAPTVEARAAAATRPASERPLVLVGPYEHHSNLLPWRESIADVRTIPEDAEHGGPDLSKLASELEAASDRPLRIGALQVRV